MPSAADRGRTESTTAASKYWYTTSEPQETTEPADTTPTPTKPEPDDEAPDTHDTESLDESEDPTGDRDAPSAHATPPDTPEPCTDTEDPPKIEPDSGTTETITDNETCVNATPAELYSRPCPAPLTSSAEEPEARDGEAHSTDSTPPRDAVTPTTDPKAHDARPSSAPTAALPTTTTTVPPSELPADGSTDDTDPTSRHESDEDESADASKESPTPARDDAPPAGAEPTSHHTRADDRQDEADDPTEPPKPTHQLEPDTK